MIGLWSHLHSLLKCVCTNWENHNFLTVFHLSTIFQSRYVKKQEKNLEKTRMICGISNSLNNFLALTKIFQDLKKIIRQHQVSVQHRSTNWFWKIKNRQFLESMWVFSALVLSTYFAWSYKKKKKTYFAWSKDYYNFHLTWALSPLKAIVLSFKGYPSKEKK